MIARVPGVLCLLFLVANDVASSFTCRPTFLGRSTITTTSKHRRSVSTNAPRSLGSVDPSPSWSSSSLLRGIDVKLDDVESGDEKDEEDEEDEEVEPGSMRVSEIKAELELRGVRFDDCFDKESMVVRLREARSKGTADPSVVDAFADKKKAATGGDIKDEDIAQVVAGDGKLPGGMSPDMLKQLMGNPELMAMLQNPKMQEAMKLMMTGGQEALEQRMAEDAEIKEMIAKLNAIMASAM